MNNAALAADLDLLPRGVEVFDLRGRLTRKQGHDFYTEARKSRLYGAERRQWQPSDAAEMGALALATERRLEKATKAEIAAFLIAGYPASMSLYLGDLTKSDLVTRAMIACYEAWFPAEYVNEIVAA